MRPGDRHERGSGRLDGAVLRGPRGAPELHAGRVLGGGGRAGGAARGRRGGPCAGAAALGGRPVAPRSTGLPLLTAMLLFRRTNACLPLTQLYLCPTQLQVATPGSSRCVRWQVCPQGSLSSNHLHVALCTVPRRRESRLAGGLLRVNDIGRPRLAGRRRPPRGRAGRRPHSGGRQALPKP